MNAMADLTIPLHGLAQAEARVNTSASRIARLGSQTSSSEDTVDLSAEMVALLESSNSYASNVNVARSFEEMSRTLLNILA